MNIEQWKKRIRRVNHNLAARDWVFLLVVYFVSEYENVSTRASASGSFRVNIDVVVVTFSFLISCQLIFPQI